MNFHEKSTFFPVFFGSIHFHTFKVHINQENAFHVQFAQAADAQLRAPAMVVPFICAKKGGCNKSINLTCTIKRYAQLRVTFSKNTF